MLAVDDLGWHGGCGAPAAPDGLVAAAAGSSAVDLTWNDNSPDETNFNIERSLDGTSFSPLTSVGPNSTGYSDRS